MASARPIMEQPALPKQTGVVIELSIAEARILRCTLGSSKATAQAMRDFAEGSCAPEHRDEYLEVAGLGSIVAQTLNHILWQIKDALPDEYSDN